MIASILLCAFVMSVTGSLEEECTILMKLDSLETRVQGQEISLEEYQISLREQAVSLTEKDTRIGDLEQSMTELVSSSTEKTTRIGELEASLSQQETDISELRTALNTALNINTTVLANLEQRLRPVQAVGFTARTPLTSQISPSHMAFEYVVTNEGGAFNASTGIFTCPVAGYYYFSMTLMKDYSHDGSAHCTMFKNDGWIADAHTYPGHTPHLGQYPAVNGAYTRLAVNETIRLQCAKPIEDVFAPQSAFTGFLVTPDG